MAKKDNEDTAPKKSRGNVDNLIPVTERSVDEVKKMQSKGGINSGKTRRKKRDAKEAALFFLSLPAHEQSDKYLEVLGVDEKERTNLMGIMARHTYQAQGGNIHSARLILEVAGNLQKDVGNRMNINVNKDDDKVVFYIPQPDED